MSGTDWGPGDVGGGPPGASPEYGGALDGQRERERRPQADPKPRPGCLQTLVAIILLLIALLVAWYLFGLVTDALA